MEFDIVFLKSTQLYRSLTEEEIRSSLSQMNAKVKKYDKRETILHAGSRTGCLCLVLSGSVTIENNDMWGNRSILSHISTGDFFAETYAVLSGEPMLVDAVSNDDTEILFLDIQQLIHHAGNLDAGQQRFLANLLLISSRKNLMLSVRSFHTAPKSARGRIMAYLDSVSLQKESREFDIPFDRQQMADYLNLERTALSKELGRMRKDGLILYSKNHFTIL